MTGSGKIGRWIGFVGLAVLAISSCRKTEKIDLNPNLNVANDIIIAQRPVLNTFRMLVRAVNDTDLQLTGHGYFDGASVTFNPALNKYSFHYFGSYGPDSVARSGTVDAILSGNFAEQGTRVRFSFSAYFEDAMNFNAGDSMVNTGTSGSDLTFSNLIVGGAVLKDTSGTILFSADLQYRVPLNPTGVPAHALITVSGMMGGTSSKGYGFNASIAAPIVYPVYPTICAYIREGSLPFSFAGNTATAGTITLPPVNSCNDSVYYDFGGTVYRWRMKLRYLAH
jgi:hypothetical protein